VRRIRALKAPLDVPRPLDAYLLCVHLSQDRVRLSAFLLGPDTPVPVHSGRILTSIPFPSRPSTGEIAQALGELGLISEAARAAIPRIGEGQTAELAVGRPPLPSLPGHWRLTAPPLIDPVAWHLPPRLVSQGEQVARFVAARPGQAGQSALGEPLPEPPPVRRVPAYRPGEGVHVEKGAMLASRAGYPIVRRGRGGLLLSVAQLPSLAASEGLRRLYDHGLLVTANLSQAQVQTSGPLMLLGGAQDSNLSTVGAELVVTGAAVRSTLAVLAPADQRLQLESLATVREELARLLNTVAEVQKEPSFSGYDLAREGVGRLLTLLLRHPRLKGLVPAAEAFHRFAGRPPARAVAEELLELLSAERLGQLRDLEPLETLALDLQALERQLTDVRFLPVLHLAAADNATVTATGIVRVHGRGLYRSRVEAAHLLMPASDVRGGRVAVRGRLVCRELGSEQAVPTDVVAREVYARAVYPGVVLTLEGEARSVTEALYDVHFAVRKGAIVVEPWNRRDRREA
jgi:hypothetical protein